MPSNIKIENIYYMLSYAFQTLRHEGYKDLLNEKFDHANDLLAAILAKGIACQIRRGLGREYLLKTDALSTPVGKMSLTSSIGLLSTRKRKISCDFDEFTYNNELNKILKSTAIMLLCNPNVKESRKSSLKKVLVFFSEVETTNLSMVSWHNIKYNRNNATYEMLINICYLVAKDSIQSENKGSEKIANFVDEQKIHRLFEKFILEYYKYHYPSLHIAPEYINWASDDGFVTLLPTMKTDVTIRTKHDNILVIDAKYYNHIMQNNDYFESTSIRSQHLYQIYSYVKNLDVTNSGKVWGMLLYAKSDDTVLPNNSYLLGGNRICVSTLDLSSDFSVISTKLDGIISNWHKEATNTELKRKD